MPQTISTIPNMKIIEGDCILRIENGVPVEMTDNYKDMEFQSLPQFVIYILKEWDSPNGDNELFFVDHGDEYCYFAEYCATKITGDQDTFEGVVGHFVFEINATKDSVVGVIRRDPELRRHREQFKELMDTESFWTLIREEVKKAKNEIGAKQYLADIFTKSKSFEELGEKLNSGEIEPHMQKLEEDSWDAINRTLNECIKGGPTVMVRSITDIPDVNINDGVCTMEIENGKPVDMCDDNKGEQYYKIPVFIIDVLADHDASFFKDHEDKHRSFAGYCATEITNDHDTFEKVVERYLPDARNIMEIIRRDTELRRHRKQFKELMRTESFWKDVDGTLDKANTEFGAKAYLADIFTKSDSFADLAKTLRSDELAGHMQKLEESCWDAVRYKLNEYIKKKDQK